MPEKLGEANLLQSTHGRKRKQSPPPSSSMPDTPTSSTLAYQQSTITDHFSPRSQSPSVTAPKRSKANSVEPTIKKENIKPITEASMLNFGSRAEPIDLTDAPPTKLRTTAPSSSTVKPALNKPPAFQTNTGTRRLQVKNLRKPTKNNAEVYFNNTWKSLDTALTQIFGKEKVTASLEELYRGVENICRADRAPQLFEKLKVRCEAHVQGPLKSDIKAIVASDVVEVARVVKAAWTQWTDQLRLTRSIFLYLDRSYLFPSPTQLSIEETGISQFWKYIVSDPDIKSKTLEGMMVLFEQDRNNRGQDSVNVGLLLSCVRMISRLGAYSTYFEALYIERSREYFSRLAKRESQSHGLARYLRECSEQLKGEALRCDKFQLEHSTKREVIAVLEDEMIRKMEKVLSDEEQVRGLLEKMDLDSIQTLYNLLGRVTEAGRSAGQSLKAAWDSYILLEGGKIVTDKERVTDMVPRLLDFKGALGMIWNGPLKRDETIGYALRESFQQFINERRPGQSEANNSKPAEMIAKYIDMLLRNGTKGLPPVSGVGGIDDGRDDDAELAHRLELVVDIFRFIQGKDVFEAFYKKDLARRLLMGRSASVDAERLMLTKLKTECGAGFTHNLEGMFKDMDLSKESVASFKSLKTTLDKSHGVDLYVNILSQAAWPTYPEIPVNLPQKLAEYLEAFAIYYVTKHQGRKLHWRHSLSHCVLKADFPKGKKELMLSAFQTVVLLAFNDGGEKGVLTYADLESASGLTEIELKRTLQSMACGKTRILTKSPKGRDVNITDKFQINLGFSDPKFRVKVNQIQLKETKEENKETHERVTQDRQFETQAAIIRIMKSRKTIKHVELVQQVIEQTKNRGMLDVADIKKNIEKLVDKEYMERTEEDANIYRYVA